MNLDTRTMMVMIAVLALMLAALLALVGLHAGKARGIKQWSAANLCTGIALLFALFQEGYVAGSWLVVVGSTFLAMSFALQYAGLRAFREQQLVLWIPSGIVIWVFVQSVWFVIIHENVNARIVVNSLAYGLICFICARQLLISAEQPLKTAYWLTGMSYVSLIGVFAYRSITILLHPEQTFHLYGPMAINPGGFFVGTLTLLALSFGFVLMVNYRMANELQSLASQDSLTGALTRRSFTAEAERLLSRHARTSEPLTLLMVDVDHFKKTNDQFGHVAGDDVLCHLSEVVRSTVRVEDYFARYGGEEFCVLLPGIKAEGAIALAERLRERYEREPIVIAEQRIPSTISIGVAEAPPGMVAIKDLVAAADQAMYEAKRNGRNQVVVYSANPE